MRFVAFADVQGNPLAAEAILRAAKRVEEAEVVCLGNAVGTGPDPAGAVERLRKARAHLVRGPNDAATLGMPSAEAAMFQGKANAARLAAADLAYLKLASPPRRLVANGKRILLTSDPAPDAGQADVVLKPGPRPLVTRTGGRLDIAVGRADDEVGESPYVVFDAETSEAKVHYAPWDRAALRKLQRAGPG